MKAIDVFSGCGGLSLGLKQAGYDVVAAVELDPKAASVYARNHPSTVLLRQDVKATSGKALLKRVGLKQGQLDLLAGCPPCQGFSRIRHRNKGTVLDERNYLVDDFARLVLEIKPKSIIMENVAAIANFDRFALFLDQLVGNKYYINISVQDAMFFGVPQRRRRLILLASSVARPKAAHPLKKRMTVRDTIGSLPQPGFGQDELHNIPEKRSARIRKMIEQVTPDGGSRKGLPPKFTLRCHAKSDGFSDVYGRMAWDRPAPTITSGCSNPSKGRFIHPDQHRCITLREAALLQGFPADYDFDPTLGKEALALMIGNALPPPFVEAHARMLRQASYDRNGQRRSD